MMYKVLLVDDENFILEGLKSIIEWNELDLDIIGTASNGEEALKIIIERPIDIVITDITMPKMNGLELIEKMKEVSKKIKFIILSGYDDFDYAKRALKLGIENYILKPINEEELEATLKNTVEKLKFEKPEVGKNSDIIRDNILFRWVQNNISYYELEERSILLDINLKYKYYQVAIIKLNNNLHKCIDVFNYMKEYSRTINKCSVFLDSNRDVICIYSSDSMENKFKIKLVYLMDILKRILNVDIFITIGHRENGYKNIHNSYRTSRELQKYLLVEGYNSLITYEEYSNKNSIVKNVDEHAIMDNFNKVIITKNKNTIKEYINELFNTLSTDVCITPETIQNISIKILLSINKMKEDFNIINDSEHGNIKDLILNICEIETIEELKIVLENRCNKFINDIDHNFEGLSPVTKQVVAYIKHNYKEELSLKTLALKYNINSSYLGQVFLKEVGEAFNEYINKIRNEESRNLILNTNLRINEIAQKVGYTDTSYFYRKFKAYYGLSPSKLRENKSY